MKLGIWTGGNVLIMHVIFFSSSNENCGCYGNGNSPNVVKKYGSWDNSKIIRANFTKLGMWTGGNVLIMHVIFLAHLSKAQSELLWSLSVRRPSVRRPSVVRPFTIACEHDRDNIFDPIFIKLGQNVCLHKSLVPFESGSFRVTN